MRRDRVDPHILDEGHLAAQTFSDRALEEELLDLFERQCGTLTPVIAGARSLEERSRAAHTLKGSARAIGAWRIAAAAERIEALIAEGRTDGMAGPAAELALAVRMTQAAIAERRNA
jgi:HPt (histidine-containing phosphotransfer) domain-containing protein